MSHHSSTFAASELSYANVLVEAPSVLSSANISSSVFSVATVKSFMKLMKRRGPKMEPYGTPGTTSAD